jgi:hypothetical protein
MKHIILAAALGTALSSGARLVGSLEGSIRGDGQTRRGLGWYREIWNVSNVDAPLETAGRMASPS